MNERLLNPISNAELDRRWAAVRAAMAERRVEALVVQSNNDWLGGYAKWLTDHPATNGYPKSVIFYANDAQKKVAQSYIAQLEKTGLFGAPIVTQVVPLQAFYPAEGYHQDYLLENPSAPYIVYNDLPKIRNFQRLLPVLYQAKAVTITELKQ